MASQQKLMFSLIAKLGGGNNKVVVDRTLCQYMGSLEGGVFLSQLLYWSDKGDGDGWFYKSYKEWFDEIFLSEYQVRQCVKVCTEMGFLKTKVQKARGSPTVHYLLDMQLLSESILKFLSIQDNEKFKYGNQKISVSETEIFEEPYTEITTNTTSKITSNKKKAAPSHPMTNPIKDAYVNAVGHKLPPSAFRTIAPDAKFAAEEGFLPEEVEKMYATMKLDEYWNGKTIPLRVVLEKITNTKLTMRNDNLGQAESPPQSGFTDEQVAHIRKLRSEGKREEAGAYIRGINEKVYGKTS